MRGLGGASDDMPNYCTRVQGALASAPPLSSQTTLSSSSRPLQRSSCAIAASAYATRNSASVAGCTRRVASSPSQAEADRRVEAHDDDLAGFAALLAPATRRGAHVAPKAWSWCAIAKKKSSAVRSGDQRIGPDRCAMIAAIFVASQCACVCVCDIACAACGGRAFKAGNTALDMPRVFGCCFRARGPFITRPSLGEWL